MARRYSSPEDFELVGMDRDPTPGDPDLIQGVMQRYQDVGDAAEKALNILKRDGAISQGRGSAMDKLKEKIGDDLPDKLSKTMTSYQDAAQAYSDYMPRLREAQETFDRAVDQARAAAPQANQAPVTLSENPTDEERAAATQQQDAIQAGQDALSAARSLAQQARQMRESAQAQCAGVLERAASEAIPERSVFEKINDFFADFPFVKILLGILAAVVAVFFPVVGALLGGALFALDQVAAIATGNFSLGDFAVGLLGLVPGGALLKGGSGAAKLGPGATQSAGGGLTGIKSTFDSTKTVGGSLGGSAGGIAKQAAGEFASSAAEEAATQVLNGEGLDVGAILGAGAVGGLTGGLAGGLAGRGRGNPPPIPGKGSGEGRGSGGPFAASGGGGTRSLQGGPSSSGSPGGQSPAPSGADSGLPSAQLDPSVDPNNITGITGPPVFRTGNEPLFRSDTRPPIDLNDPENPFNAGFAPKDPSNTNLPDFVEQNTPSAFVSTTRNEQLNFNGGLSFRFHINAPGGIDVNETLGRHGNESQREISFPGGIRPENIRGATAIRTTGPFLPAKEGNFFPNPRFNPAFLPLPPSPPPTANTFPVPSAPDTTPAVPADPPPRRPLPPPRPAPAGGLPAVPADPPPRRPGRPLRPPRPAPAGGLPPIPARPGPPPSVPLPPPPGPPPPPPA